MPNKKQHKKVFSFSRGADFYFSMAENAIAKSDYMTALGSLFRALSMDKDNIEYKTRLAEVYFLTEQYDLSNNIYFEIFAADRTATHVFSGIGQNFYYQGNIDAALYYLNAYAATSLDLEEFDAEELIRLFAEDVSDEYYPDDYRLVYPEKPPTAQNSFAIGKNLMRRNKFEEAVEMFETALQTEPDNTLVKNHLTTAQIYLQRYPDAKKNAQSVLKACPDDYFAIGNLCLIYNATGQKAKLQKNLKILQTIQTEDTAEIFKIATVLCEIGCHSDAVRYLQKIHRDRPYDENIMMLIALAEYNCGNLEASLKFFVKILRLFENDHIAEYYIKYIKDILDGKNISPAKTLPYSPFLPLEEREKRIKQLSQAATLPKEKLQKMWLHGDLPVLCDWAISIGEDEVSLPVVRLISQISAPTAREYLKDLLLNVNSGNILRKEIIRLLVFYGKEKQINYLYDDIFTTVTPKRPKLLSEAPHVFTHAFSLAFSLLCFVTENFETKLCRITGEAIKRLQEKEGGQDLTSIEAIAAVLCFKMKAGELMEKKDFLCEAFEVDIAAFNRYLAALS